MGASIKTAFKIHKDSQRRLTMTLKLLLQKWSIIVKRVMAYSTIQQAHSHLPLKGVSEKSALKKSRTGHQLVNAG